MRTGNITVLAATGMLALHAPAGAQAPVFPVGAGCTDDGPTRSDTAPSVRIAPEGVLRRTGTVHIFVLDATQTAGTSVSIVQRGGLTLGAIGAGRYACVVAGQARGTITVAVSPYARRLIRRRHALPVTVTLVLVNGSNFSRVVRARVTLRPEAKQS